MKTIALMFVTALSATTFCAGCQAASDPVNVCEIGPLIKQYGGTEWYVYSCSDERSLVVVASPANPAAKPFAFIVSEEKGVQQLNGGGERKGTVEATYNELKALKSAQIATLAADAKSRCARMQRRNGSASQAALRMRGAACAFTERKEPWQRLRHLNASALR